MSEEIEENRSYVLILWLKLYMLENKPCNGELHAIFLHAMKIRYHGSEVE